MKVLVTGATGYIGSNVRGYIKEMGHDVRLFVRLSSEDKIDTSDSYEVVTGDIFDTNACLAACDGCDVVVHLVGIAREFPAKGITFDQYHRAATENIINAAKIGGVPHFIHMSALGTRDNAPSIYHQSKFTGEEVVRQSGLRWTIFRPSWIFGEGDHGTKLIVNLIHKPVVPLVNGGSMMLQPISIDDVCAAVSKSIEMPETQGKTFELGGPDRIAFKDIVGQIASQLGVSIRTMNVSSAMIRPVVAMMERYPWFPVSTDQLRLLTEDNVCGIDPFVKTFQIEPKPFSQIIPTLFGSTGARRKTPALL